jgi:tRNA-splicing ligase RtcB
MLSETQFRHGPEAYAAASRAAFCGFNYVRGRLIPIADCYLYPKLNHVQRINHLGTLGTGNHFIEVCLDENERDAKMRPHGKTKLGFIDGDKGSLALSPPKLIDCRNS